MKHAILSVVIGIVLGVALTTLYFKTWLPIRNFGRQEMMLADVYQPLGYVLQDISHDYDRGDAALAEKKTQLLKKRWSEFLHGGPGPERFVNEIVEMQATTRPGNGNGDGVHFRGGRQKWTPSQSCSAHDL